MVHVIWRIEKCLHYPRSEWVYATVVVQVALLYVPLPIMIQLLKSGAQHFYSVPVKTSLLRQHYFFLR